ncbi:hypothetical protein Tdes44962_MAKER00824 [Teratosphaeria destructans]|uniref:Nucleoporin NUP37 n=1 Tax=Teratosphaeria destructans TaxID=418781 RepID=A0A9W7SKU7_9PEZI|nr:hypothetical protein Tdes44962_MAKER00824 [Teratosphaeria destructans]
MEPRVTKRERKLHLSYETRHRIHCSSIYPVAGPNGSTVIIYGRDNGLRILWRGGRRRKTQSQAPPQAPPKDTTNSAHEGIDLEDDEDGDAQHAQGTPHEYEQEADEEDPDCPYANIITDVEVDLETDVLQLAIPLLPTQSPHRTAQMLKAHGVVAVACSNGSQRVLTFPLAPPEDEREYADLLRSTQVTFPGNGSICHALDAKIVATDVLTPGEESQASDFLLVAAVFDTLRIYQFSIFDELTALEQDASSRIVTLPHPATQVSFHPSSKATQMLITDLSGTVRLYEPYASASSALRPSSSGSGSLNAAPGGGLGKWTFALHTSFALDKSGVAKRKRFLDVKWVLSGKAVLVLLDDGEWGVWDVSGSSKTLGEFALRGYLGSSTAADTGAPVQSKTSTRLAPMTPNTRKAKAEVLFNGTPKIPGAAARGGISIATNHSRLGSSDESILMWYNSDIYSIPSLQTFWQRATNNTNSFGSLHSPGLAHITDINLINENITSISQFAAPTSANAFGQMNTQRDLLVSAERRFVILQSIRPPAPSRSLFQQAAAAPQQPALRDQIMLDSGEAGLGEINRMLDRMDPEVARPRRVGFAH